MSNTEFIPYHINANSADFEGNGVWGRYVLIPGSDGRASKIASGWKNLQEKRHSRAHNLYLGTMSTTIGDIEVAAISTGMGAASADIIINELKQLGVCNFIRVGTAGSLQPEFIRGGEIIVPTGSVRDESTTTRYVPVEVPAVPSLDFLIAARIAMESVASQYPVHFGLVHSKDSLYAREFHAGPQKQENERYMQVLKDAGILASEMETSLLFTLGGIYNFKNISSQQTGMLVGAILAIIGDDTPIGNKDVVENAIDRAVEFGLKTLEILHGMRTGKIQPLITMEGK